MAGGIGYNYQLLGEHVRSPFERTPQAPLNFAIQ